MIRNRSSCSYNSSVATNTQFALGVHMLTLLAGTAPTQLSSEEMAGSARSNPVHVRRVLGTLRAAGLVASKPGARGGWTLQQDPADLTLADVWRVVHGPDQEVLGLREVNPDCPIGRSVQDLLTGIDRAAQQAIADELQQTTIAQLVTRAAAGADLRALA
jgi:Rrf2 family protein